MKRSSGVAGSEPGREDRLQELYARPGFLFRRLHQIAVGLFVEECASLGLTPPQHSVLFVVSCRPALLNQAAVARALGFDRATTGQIVQGLENRGLLQRSDPSAGPGRGPLELTAEGKALLRSAAGPVRRVSQRLLSPLDGEQRRMLYELLLPIVDGFNLSSRTPLHPLPSGTAQAGEAD